VRSVLLIALGSGLYAAFVAGACASPYQGQDTELVDRSEANAPIGRDGAPSGSSSGAIPGTEAGAGETGTEQPPGEGPCDSSHGVGALEDVAGLVSADYRMGARLSEDELHVVFLQVRDRAAEGSPTDAYVASRASKTAPFDAPQKVNAAAASIVVSLSPDALSMYFTPHRPTGNDGVQITTRSSRDAMFVGAAAVAGVPAYSYSPFATAAGTLLFAQFPDSAASTILQAPVSGMGVGGAEALFGLGSNDVDFPTLSSDGAELFYTEYLQPSGGAYRRATRAGGGAFAPVPLPGLDESLHEVTWVSADACRLYVTDWRSYTLQVARRLP